MNERKSSLEEFSGRLEEAEERTRELETRAIEMIQFAGRRRGGGKVEGSEQSLREVWHTRSQQRHTLWESQRKREKMGQRGYVQK